MNIIIPLAGKDERFEKRNVFKPFIEIEGKPLIKFCTDSLEYPFKLADIQLYFIILKEHQSKYSVSERLEEMYKPMHFAISLTGEPTMYPKLPELIDEIHARGMTSYLVTNGSFPEMIEKLKGHEPTQIYVTLAAPTKELFIKDTNPLIKDAWEKFNKTIQILKDLKTRRVLRLTLTKGYNMVHPELFGEYIKNLEGHYDYVECKGYVHVGFAMQRLSKENMPTHDEIKEFAQKVGKSAGLVYVDEKPESSVVLLMKKENKNRIMNYKNWGFKPFTPIMLN